MEIQWIEFRTAQGWCTSHVQVGTGLVYGVCFDVQGLEGGGYGGYGGASRVRHAWLRGPGLLGAIWSRRPSERQVPNSGVPSLQIASIKAWQIQCKWHAPISIRSAGPLACRVDTHGIDGVRSCLKSGPWRSPLVALSEDKQHQADVTLLVALPITFLYHGHSRMSRTDLMRMCLRRGDYCQAPK